jgi:glutathione S-transferase
MPIRLFQAPWSTNCERVAMTLAHKGFEVEAVTVDYSDRSPVIEASGQPLVPVIQDDGVVVSDSLAIMRHLERRRPEPRLYPMEPARRVELELFLDWFERVWKGPPNAIEAELMRDQPDPDAIAARSRELHVRLDQFEQLLEGRDHLFGGELSAADLAAFPFLKYARSRDPADDELFHRILDEHQSAEGLPNLLAWIERVDALPRAYGR